MNLATAWHRLAKFSQEGSRGSSSGTSEKEPDERDMQASVPVQNYGRLCQHLNLFGYCTSAVVGYAMLCTSNVCPCHQITNLWKCMDLNPLSAISQPAHDSNGRDSKPEESCFIPSVDTGQCSDLKFETCSE